MIHLADGAAQERNKYAEIWSLPEYRQAHSPGEENVDRFMSVMKPTGGETLLDIGCGAGRAGLAFVEKGLRVDWLDITGAGLDPAVPRDRFYECPLWNFFYDSDRADYGFCCDMLEHIPPEYTMLTVDRILAACKSSWLQISLRPDEFGKLIGEPLHLTVRPFDWWLIRLATLGEVIDARDLCGAGLYIVRRA